MKRCMYTLIVTMLSALTLPLGASAQVTRTAPVGSGASVGEPPGEQQHRLERFVGSYIATVRTWDTPNDEPAERILISEQRMIMGGRFLEVVDRTEDGAYHWRAVHGFDTTKGHYVSIGISNQSNAFSIADSHIDDEGHWLVFGPAGQDPTFKGVGALTADGYTYTNYRLGPDGTETKYREIVYRRR